MIQFRKLYRQNLQKQEIYRVYLQFIIYFLNQNQFIKQKNANMNNLIWWVKYKKSFVREKPG